jgi:hypothetical protein
MTYNRPGAGTHVVNDTAGILTPQPARKLQGFVGVRRQAEGDEVERRSGRPNADPDRREVLADHEGDRPGGQRGRVREGRSGLHHASNVLTETATSNTKFGRVIEVVGDGRSVPTGKVRISLDAKDSF